MFADLYRHLLQLMFVVSAVFIVGGIAFAAFTWRKKRGAASIAAVLTAVTAVMNTGGTLLLGLSGARVSPPDDAAQTITRFYRDVEAKELDRAYVLLHSARRKEVALDAFERSYAKTIRYTNLDVMLDHAEGTDARLYWVNFDVYDRLPTDALSQYQWRSLDESVKAGIVNLAGVVRQLASDLRKTYELPENKLSDLEDLIRKTKFHWIFEEPTAVYEIASYMKLEPRIPGEFDDYWSHYIQHIKLVDEDGWKIRSGLFPPALLALYPPGSEKPSGARSNVGVGRAP